MSRVKAFHYLLVVIFLAGCSQEPLEYQAVTERASYLVGAYYNETYPEGFEKGHLRSRLEPPQKPALGRYSLFDPAVVDQHIAMASEWGIDFFVRDIDVKNERSIHRLEAFLQSPNIGDIQFCLRLKIEELEESELAWIEKTYFSHPQYLKKDGQPVLLVSTSKSSKKIASSLRRLRAELGKKPYLVWDMSLKQARSLPDEELPLEALTISQVFAPEKAQYSGYASATPFLEQTKELLLSLQERKPVYIPCILPGFNARGLSPKKLRSSAILPRLWRASGKALIAKLFEEFARPYLSEDQPILLVNSWNNWANDTAIENLESAPVTTLPLRLTGGYPYGGLGRSSLQELADKTMALSGRVYTLDGQAQPNISVSVWNGRELFSKTKTDTQGRFRFSRLAIPPGRYLVGCAYSEAIETEVTSQTCARYLALLTKEKGDETSHLPVSLEPRLPFLQKAQVKYLSQFPIKDYTLLKVGDSKAFLKSTEASRWKPLHRALGPKKWLEEILRAHIKPGGSVAILGSEGGLLTLPINKLLGERGELMVLEPRRLEYRQLLKNLRFNAVENVTALKIAASDYFGITHLNSVSKKGVKPPAPDRVELRTFDSFFLDELDFVYIDMGLHKEEVLRGARQTLQRLKPKLLLRINNGRAYPKWHKSGTEETERTFGLLAEMGYRVEKLRDEYFLALPVKKEESSFWVDLGGATAQDPLSTGLLQPAKDGGTSYVRTYRLNSELSFRLGEASFGSYLLGLRARTVFERVPVSLEVSVNGKSLGKFLLYSHWSASEIKVPPGVIHRGLNEINFHFNPKNSNVSAQSADLDLLWLTPASAE